MSAEPPSSVEGVSPSGLPSPPPMATEKKAGHAKDVEKTEDGTRHHPDKQGPDGTFQAEQGAHGGQVLNVPETKGFLP